MLAYSKRRVFLGATRHNGQRMLASSKGSHKLLKLVDFQRLVSRMISQRGLTEPKKGVFKMWIEHGRHDWQAPKFT
jgi:hypothetical protein